MAGILIANERLHLLRREVWFSPTIVVMRSPQIIYLPSVLAAILNLHLSVVCAADPQWSHDEMIQHLKPLDMKAFTKQVRDYPQDAELAAAYIQILSGIWPGEVYVDQACRRALSFHPDDPDLLILRAKVSAPSFGMDVLADLAKVPGREVEARVLTERLSLGLYIPLPKSYDYDVKPKVPNRTNYTYYTDWSDKLLFVNRIDRAASVLDECLAKYPNPGADVESIVQNQRAAILALGKHFDAAAAIQAQQGFPQTPVGRFAGMADILLYEGEPGKAIASFGTEKDLAKIKVPSTQADGLQQPLPESRRILAWCYSETGKYDKARSLLLDENGKIHAKADALLLLQIYLKADKKSEAGKLGDDLTQAAYVESHTAGTFRIGGSLPPDSTVSLADTYVAAVQWLMDKHPDNVNDIGWTFGYPSTRHDKAIELKAIKLPSSQLIPKLKAEPKDGVVPTDNVFDTPKFTLPSALWGAHQYRELASNVFPSCRGRRRIDQQRRRSMV